MSARALILAAYFFVRVFSMYDEHGGTADPNPWSVPLYWEIVGPFQTPEGCKAAHVALMAESECYRRQS